MSLWLCSVAGSVAEEVSADATVAPAEVSEGDYIFPGKTRSEEAVRAAATSETGDAQGFYLGLFQAFLFLTLMGAGGFLLVQRLRQGKGPLKSRINRALGQGESGLRVEETRMLGNKQYLVVVSYADKKMLIGVGPGLINHLCYLNDNFAGAFSDVEDAAGESAPTASGFSAVDTAPAENAPATAGRARHN
ncbi:MAG: flagellar biosynthetic protein FliO [Opitutales bacterium]